VGGFAFKIAEGVCRSARRHLRKALQGLTIPPTPATSSPRRLAHHHRTYLVSIQKGWISVQAKTAAISQPQA